MADLKRTPTALDKLLRTKTIDEIFTFLSTKGEDVLRIDGTTIAYPTINDDGEDSWIQLVISVPKGEKIDGGFAGYDGYERAETYKKAQEDIAAKAKKSQEKAAADSAKRTKKTKETKPAIEE